MMRNVQSPGKIDNERWFEALDWYTRLNENGEPQPPRDEVLSWKLWVSDSENRHVFDQLVRLLGDSALHLTKSRPSQDEIENDPYDASIPLAQWKARFTTSAPQGLPTFLPHLQRPRTFGAVCAGVAIVLLCTVVLLVATRWRATAPSEPLQTYTTRWGEVRRVRLDDGSNVVLGGQSSLSVQITPQRRSMRLEQGEALFQVVRDPLRPFVVAAGERIITALGTAFVVRRDSDRVMVTVTDGSVEVLAPASEDRTAARSELGLTQSFNRSVAEIARGQRISYADRGTTSLIKHANAAAATAWAEGQLEFDDEPLRYVIETVNRYSRRQITLAPVDVSLHYTGVVLQDQVDDWVCGLETIYPVEVIAHERELEVRPRGKSPSTQQFCTANR